MDGYDDRITIATPEGVDLDITLAGIGSRFAAAMIDTLIKLAIFLGLVAGLGAVGAVTAGRFGPADAPSDTIVLLGLALFLLLVFLVSFGYDVAFEVLASGRTPGKRWTGLRVVLAGGGPVTFKASAVRNLLRLVDGLIFYAVGMITVLASERNQRLGDMVGGTLVIRERGDRQRGSRPAMPPPPLPAGLDSWDVSSVTSEEVATVRRFLERRHELAPEARNRLGWELAERLGPKVAGAPIPQHHEAWLEQLVAAKASRA